MNPYLKIAIAETSAILRCGLESVLKRFPGFHIQIIDIASEDVLLDSLKMHRPDILVINPLLPGLNRSVAQLKEDSGCPQLKCVAFLAVIIPDDVLKPYDEQITLYHDLEEIKQRLERLLEADEPEEPADEEAQNLSSREKEIVVCVVKGMTNREIADRLCISAHTVITHRRNIARKLQIHTPSGLTIYAIVNKLVELSEISPKSEEAN